MNIEDDPEMNETPAQLGDLLALQGLVDDLRKIITTQASSLQQLTNALGMLQQTQARQLAILEKLADRVTE